MTDVAVRHLHLRGPPGRQGLDAFRISDAFNTEVRDDRLVLVRRVEIGRLPGAAHPRALPDQLAGAWRRVLAGAAHGSANSADGANCVWFADAAEARRLLTLRLARGQAVDAWYWRLAVPDWRGDPAEAWITSEVARAVSTGDGAALLRTIELLVSVGALAPLIRALAMLSSVAESSAEPFDEVAPVSPQRAGRQTAPGGDAPVDTSAAPVAQRLPTAQARRVARLIARMPTALRDALRRLATIAAPAPAALRTIGAAMAGRHWPELRLAGGRIDTLVEEWVAQIVDPLRHAEALRIPPDAPTSAPVHDAAQAVRPRSAGPQPIDGDSGPAARRVGAEVRRANGVEPTASQAAPPIDQSEIHESVSPAAGLFLCVIPLIELGWREWLAEREDLWGSAPGPRLLDHIAAHHRVLSEDPARLVWDLDPEPEEDWLNLWRVGLDRWLRRRTGVNLHKLIWRRGWIATGEDALRIRFPAHAADIRLRRRALDRDPGWVDWLGRSVRYVYRDTPDMGGMA